MKIIILISALVIIVFSILIYIKIKRKKNREFIARKKRENFNSNLNSLHIKIVRAIEEFAILKQKKRYICGLDIFKYLEKYKKLYNDINFNQIDSLADEGVPKNIAKLFGNNYANISTIIKKTNEEFIESELIKYKKLFNNLENKSLDNQQRKAIIIDEDNNIVIAGAGSGKTTTIAGKVKYLIDKYKIEPEEILLIAFTNKAVS